MKFPYILHCKSIIIDFQSPRQIWMSQISQGPPFEIQILQRSLECSQISRSWSWDWQCSQIVHFMPNKFFLRLQLWRNWGCSWRFWRHSGIIWKSGVGNSWSCCHAGWELVLFMVRNICKKKMQKKNLTKKSKNENKNIIIERSGFLLIACLEENWRVHYGRFFRVLSKKQCLFFWFEMWFNMLINVFYCL